jgi:hypothetical protein
LLLLSTLPDKLENIKNGDCGDIGISNGEEINPGRSKCGKSKLTSQLTGDNKGQVELSPSVKSLKTSLMGKEGETIGLKKDPPSPRKFKHSPDYFTTEDEKRVSKHGSVPCEHIPGE